MSDLADKVLATFTEENRKRPPTRREIYTFVADSTLVLAAEMKGLRERIEELEKSGTKFRGVYQRAGAYRRGDQATHKGSLWTALTTVPEGTVPGESPAHWQLAAKGTG